jgi:tetratricopeptide (TPR) repeat protein
MPVEQDSLLKSLADRMAGMLAGGGGADAVLLLERFGLLDGTEAAPGTRPGVAGIWEPGPQGYRRAESLRQEWHYWANVPTIPPKGERKRIVLVGESVARGFLYDPEFNPAQALEAALTAVLGEPAEVVDLARSDLKARDIPGLLESAMALEPDALVLFAGNNWVLYEKRDRHLEATVLRERGALGLKEIRERRLAALLEGTLRPKLAELSSRVPIVVVVPEINLADWRLDAEADAPWLPGGDNRPWLERRAAARAALAAGRLDEAEGLAREMVALDRDTAATGWTLLADCASARGDLEAARACLETARDAHNWDYTHQTPRTFSLSQRALRGCALPGRIAVVDLPSRFGSWLGGEIPGRRLFLDYCHLTSEGIRVAMAAAALETASLLGSDRPLPALESLVSEVPAPSDLVEAAAHFAGALHSAHWGQSGPIVSHLCHEAARRSPEIARAMRVYLELQTRRAPTWACTAAEGLSDVSTPFLRGYIQQHQAKLFDPVLLPAIAGALEANGLPSRAFLDELRRERSLSERPRDLLDPYHRASWADLDWLEWPTHFRRAYSPISRYPWVCRAPREVAFELTCRKSGADGAGE